MTIDSNKLIVMVIQNNPVSVHNNLLSAGALPSGSSLSIPAIAQGIQDKAVELKDDHLFANWIERMLEVPVALEAKYGQELHAMHGAGNAASKQIAKAIHSQADTTGGSGIRDMFERVENSAKTHPVVYILVLGLFFVGFYYTSKYLLNKFF